MEDRIIRIDFWTLRIPLPAPLFLGETRIETREFAVAVIETSGGLRGWGATFTRNAPVEAVARHCFLPLLIGENALLTEKLWQKMHRAAFLYGQEGLAARAMSILDIALWDLKAKRASLPLYQLLGGVEERVPLLIPMGYRREESSPEDMIDEIQFYKKSGIRAVKFMFPPRQLAGCAALVIEARRILGPQAIIGNDFIAAGNNAVEILRALECVAEARLDFIEDPFPICRKKAFAALSAGWAGRIMTGELTGGLQTAHEVLSLSNLHAVRWDATACGGVSPWLKMQAMAAAQGLPVYPHCAPEVHAHLCAATGQPFVETSLPAYESIHFAAVLDGDWPIQDGYYCLGNTPGLGLEFDQEKGMPFRVKI